MNELKLKGSPSIGLTGATLGFFFGSAAISLFGPSAIRFKEAMDLSPALLGLLVAIPSLTGSLLRIPFGAWVDTTGGKRPLLILMILSIIGLGGLSVLLSGSYPDGMKGLYPLVLFFGCLSGCGIATFSVGVGQASYWYPKKKQGSPLAIFGGLGTMAPGIFALLLPLYLNTYGFVSAYFAWTIFLVIGTVLYLLIGKNAFYFQFRSAGHSEEESQAKARAAGQEMFPTGSVKQSLLVSARIPATWVLVICYFSSFGGFIALTAWYPSFWHQYFEFDLVKAGLFTALFSILSAVLRIPSGWLSDKIGGIQVVYLAMSILLGASLVMGFVSSEGMSLVCMLLIALSCGLNNAAIFKLVPQYVPNCIGGASGWVGGLGAFGGFVLPTIMGWVVSWLGNDGYAKGFWVFSILAVFNLFVLRFGLNRKSCAD